jgi:hypothetical protein
MNTTIEHVLLTSGFFFAGIYMLSVFCLLRRAEAPIFLSKYRSRLPTGASKRLHICQPPESEHH